MASPSTVLVIESVPSRRRLLGEHLRKRGHTVLHADLPDDAAVDTWASPVDVIVISVEPEQTDRIAGLARLREKPKAAGARLLVVTSLFGGAQKRLAGAMAQVSVTEFIVQPMKLREYLVAVKKLAEMGPLSTDVRRTVHQPDPDPDEKVTPDEARQMLEALQSQDYFQRLNVWRGAPLDLTRSNFLRSMRRYHPSAAPPNDRQFAELLAGIHAALLEAFGTLRDEWKHEKYKKQCDAALEMERAATAYEPPPRVEPAPAPRPALDLATPTPQTTSEESGMHDLWAQGGDRRNRHESIADAAHLRAASGEYPDAIKLIEKAIGLDPENPTYRYRVELYRGLSFLKRGTLGMARRRFKVAVNIAPQGCTRAAEELEALTPVVPDSGVLDVKLAQWVSGGAPSASLPGESDGSPDTPPSP